MVDEVMSSSTTTPSAAAEKPFASNIDKLKAIYNYSESCDGGYCEKARPIFAALEAQVEDGTSVDKLRSAICRDMDNNLPLHSPQWDYARDVILYIDAIKKGTIFIEPYPTPQGIGTSLESLKADVEDGKRRLTDLLTFVDGRIKFYERIARGAEDGENTLPTDLVQMFPPTTAEIADAQADAVILELREVRFQIVRAAQQAGEKGATT
jgi:hypothetical protein